MKHLQWMLCASLLCGGSWMTVACGGSDDKPAEEAENSGSNAEQQGTGDPSNPNNPVTPGVVLTSEAQKERMITIGKDFMSRVPASDFDEVANVAEYIIDNYTSNAAVDPLAQWAKECFKSLEKNKWDEQEFLWTSEGESYNYYNEQTYHYQYNYYQLRQFTRRFYVLSKFLAHVKWNESTGKWEITEENTSDAQITCKDQGGRTVVAMVKASGKTKRVFVMERRGDDDMLNPAPWPLWADDVRDIYFVDEFERIYLDVPEQIDVTLTIGGSTILNVQVKTDLSSMSGTGFDLSKDSYTVDVTAKVLGYTFKNVHVAAQANASDKVKVSFTMEKDDQKLLDVSVVGTADVAEEGAQWSEETFDDFDMENTNGSVKTATVDIMGKMQLKASCSNLRKYAENIDKALDNKYDESKAKSYVQAANALTTGTLYYDNGSTEQAKFRWEVFGKSDKKGGSTRYTAQPVIVFSDGSQYSIVNESFFNEDNFRQIIDVANKLVKDYERLAHRFK